MQITSGLQFHFHLFLHSSLGGQAGDVMFAATGVSGEGLLFGSPGQGGVRTEGAIWGNGNSRCKGRERRRHRMSAGFEQRAQGRRSQECAGAKRLRPELEGT